MEHNKKSLPAEALRGRPKKEVDDKLNRSINLKLTESDLKTIRERAAKVGLSPTQYARIMTLKGAIKNRFTAEELDLMRKIAGVANNVNQIAKRLNSDQKRYVFEACNIVVKLKMMIDDSEKHKR